MDKILPFKIFCLENFKTVHNLTGKAALDIFIKYHVFDYIIEFYDILHSYGALYIINNIDEFIAHRDETANAS